MLVTIMLLMDGLKYILPEDLKDRPRIGEQNQTYFAPEETTIYHYWIYWMKLDVVITTSNYRQIWHSN